MGKGVLASLNCITFAVIFLRAVSAAHVTYVDGDSFINAAAEHVLTAHGVSGVLSALLNVETSNQQGVSQQVHLLYERARVIRWHAYVSAAMV